MERPAILNTSKPGVPERVGGVLDGVCTVVTLQMPYGSEKLQGRFPHPQNPCYTRSTKSDIAHS